MKFLTKDDDMNLHGNLQLNVQTKTVFNMKKTLCSQMILIQTFPCEFFFFTKTYMNTGEGNIELDHSGQHNFFDINNEGKGPI